MIKFETGDRVIHKALNKRGVFIRYCRHYRSYSGTPRVYVQWEGNKTVTDIESCMIRKAEDGE